MTELTSQELLLINGGSQETYQNGKAAGEKVREFLDDAALAWFICEVAALVIFKVKI